MKNFFSKVGGWCSSHIWQTAVIGVAVVGVVATSITLPIVLGGKKDDPVKPDPQPTHTHTYAEAWTTNSTQHWHAATCEHTDLKSDEGAHIDQNKDYKCDVCGFDLPQPEPENAADTVIYGNIVTMDESNPSVQAVAVKDGKISAVGTKEDISKLAGSKTIIKDFENNFVYPGFVDTHTHYAVMTNILTDGLTFNREGEGYQLGDYEAYGKLIKEFVDANPNKEIYQAFGLWVVGQPPTAKMLDEYVPTDKPVVCVGAGGHDIWLNTPAIKRFVGNFEGTEDEKKEVDKWIETVGRNCVEFEEVDDHKVPKGYFCETARFRITDQIPHSVEAIKETIKGLEINSLCKGYTTVGDCTIVESETNKQVTAFKELEAAGELKYKYRSYYEIREYDSKETREAELKKAIELAKETKDSDHFQIVGIKVFLDGVYEALSAYTLEEYTPDAGKAEGYKGIQRWYGLPGEGLDKELKELVYNANNAGLAMEFHAMGDGAIRQGLDACAYANKKLKDEGKEPCKRNALSHLGYIHPDDMPRFNELGVTAVVAPQWTSANVSIFPQETKTLGKEKAERMYLIKSLMDSGANVAFHTDGAVFGGVPEMIYDATTRKDASNPSSVLHVRAEEECITGLDSLKCLTTNAAYTLSSEHNLGCIKVGYAADFTVYNKDYRDNSVATSLEAFNSAKLLGLIVNGQTINLSSIQ